MLTKLGQFTKFGPFSTFQLFKLSKLCYHFLSHYENKNNFFLISLAIPCPLPSGIHWPINFTEKLMFLYIVNNNKKVTSFSGPFSTFQFCTFLFVWKYTETSFFLVKFIGQWNPDDEWRGIARDIKKK